MLFNSSSKTPAIILGNGNKDSVHPKSAIFFLIKRIFLSLLLGIPALFIIHLCLLAVYSNILEVPHPGFHPGFPGGPDDDAFGPPRPPPPPPPPPHAHIPSPPPGSGRASDVSNTFLSYKHAQTCSVSSQDLHTPIHPPCTSRQHVLDAMSYGGRAGFDRPYIPFGCNMQWYSTEEICEIIGRFSHIFIIGDSLQRMIVTALYTMLRQDIGLGGIAEWSFEPAKVKTDTSINKLEDCMCAHQFTRHECSHAPILKYTDAIAHSDTNPPACTSLPTDDPTHPFDITYHEIQKYPATPEDIEGILSAIPSKEKPPKPLAFIYHNTFWNDVNTTATTLWLDQLNEALVSHLPYLPKPDILTHYAPHTPGFPRLFVTANAAGIMKNAMYLDTQNSNAIARFEAEMKPHLAFRDVEVLGMYNMSVQATSSDGTHANMGTNLLKAMMVLNWLDWVGREEGERWRAVGSAGDH